MRLLIILTLILLSYVPVKAETCGNLLPRLSQDISSEDYNKSGTTVTLEPNSNKTYCFFIDDIKFPGFILTTNSDVEHQVDFLFTRKVSKKGTSTSFTYMSPNYAEFTVSTLDKKATVKIELNYPPGTQKTCIQKISCIGDGSTRAAGGGSCGSGNSAGAILRMPLGAPNPNGGTTPSNLTGSAAFLPTGSVPLPMGEYLIDARRTDPENCNDGNVLTIQLRAASEGSAKPKKPPFSKGKPCSSSSRISFPPYPWTAWTGWGWGTYQDSNVSDPTKSVRRTNAPITREWSKFCFWIEDPDVYELRLDMFQFGAAQCAQYNFTLTPPPCGKDGGSETGEDGTIPYQLPTSSKCGGKTPFTLSWTAESTSSGAANPTATPIPNATPIVTPTGGGTPQVGGTIQAGQTIIYSYYNPRNLKTLTFEATGDGVTLSVAPPPNSGLTEQKPAAVVFLGSHDKDRYARVPKGLYAVYVYGPDINTTGDRCTPPDSASDWRLIKQGTVEGNGSGPVRLKFRLPRNATFLNFNLVGAAGDVRYYLGQKQIYKGTGKVSVSELGGKSGVYYVQGNIYGRYRAELQAADAKGPIDDGQPNVCSGYTGSYTIKVIEGPAGIQPTPSPTPTPRITPTPSPVPTATPTAAPPGVFSGSNYIKANFHPYACDKKIAATVLNTYPTTVSPDIDMVLPVYKGSGDNSNLNDLVSNNLQLKRARIPYQVIGPSMSATGVKDLLNFYSLVPTSLWAGYCEFPIGQGDLTSGVKEFLKGFKGSNPPKPLPENVRVFPETASKEIWDWKGLTLDADIINHYVPFPWDPFQPRPARLRIRNSGTATWWPPSDFAVRDLISGEDTKLAETIYPGTDRDVYLSIEGDKSYQWQMVYKGTPFGYKTWVYDISVLQGTATPTPMPTPTPTGFIYEPSTPTPRPTAECPPGTRPMPPPFGVPGRCYIY